VKAGEGNPQAREEEGKLSLLSTGRSSSLAGIPRMWGVGIPWESHRFHLPLPAQALSLVLCTPSVVAELLLAWNCSSRQLA